MWHLPGLAARFGVAEAELRRTLFEETGGMFPELVTRPGPRGVPAADRRHDGLPVRRVSSGSADPDTVIACRVHDECNGSDVFGSDICTCRPYLVHGVEVCVETAQQGGVGIVVYNRKEGRALGEVTKFLVYNARKRQPGGDRADTYFRRTECVAGVQDMRFQELMPDVFHWLGIRRIDRWVSMSNMKHDALPAQGIEVVEQVAIPDGLVPLDAQVEMAAKKAAGYFAPAGVPSARRAAPHQRAAACDERDAARCGDYLLSAAAVRERCGDRPCGGRARRNPAFPAGAASGSTTRSSASSRSPAGAIPISPCRFTAAGGISRPAASTARRWSRPAPIRPRAARARIDLAIVSVLLDAGAGPRWRYREAETGLVARRAPRGLRSRACGRCRRGCSRPTRASPWRADAAALAGVHAGAARRRRFQHGPDNPLAGLEGRAALLRRLGEVIAARAGAVRRAGAARQSLRLLAAAARRPAGAGDAARWCCGRSGRSGRGGSTSDGVPLGDCGRHPAVPGDGLVPFHKLSQWLVYSLIEPLADAGFADHRPRRADRARRIPQWRSVPRLRRARRRATPG